MPCGRLCYAVSDAKGVPHKSILQMMATVRFVSVLIMCFGKVIIREDAIRRLVVVAVVVLWCSWSLPLAL